MPRRRLQNTTVPVPVLMPTSVKLNNNKPKSKPKGKGKGPSSKPKSKAPLALVSKVCGLTNPFCKEAKWGKYPDNTSMNTLNVQWHGRTATAANSSGNIGYLFIPSYTAAVYWDNTVTTAGVCLFTTGIQPAGFAVGTPAGIRTNSWGIRIRCIASPNTASGMVRIRGYANKYGTDLNSVQPQAYTADYTADIPLSQCRDVKVIARKSTPDSNLFVAPATLQSSTAVSTYTASGWSAIVVYVDGGPASVAGIDIEYIYNVEYNFADGDSMTLVATPSPAQSDMIQEAVDAVSSRIGNVFTNVADNLETLVTSRVSDYFVNRAADRLGDLRI